MSSHPNRKPVYIKPMGRPIRTPLWQRVARGLAAVAFVTAVGVLGAVVLLEWFVGCGETYVNHKGERHAYECLFVR